MTQTGLFYYVIEDLSTDIVDKIGSYVYGGNVSSLLADFPAIFWIEKDINGQDALCTSKLVGENMELTMNINTNPYTSYPQLFVIINCGTCGIFGPNPPIVKPGPRR